MMADPRQEMAAPPLLRMALPAMATRFELVLAGADPAQLRAVGEAALAEVEECEQRLSLFRPGSLLSRINTHAATDWVEVDGDTFELLELCAAIYRSSAGAFDPTIAPLMRALGLHAAGSAPVLDVDAAAALVGMDGVELDAARRAVRFARAGMALDLGAVGKGHALDLAAAVLREHGIDQALIHGGTSTVVALGAPPELPGWRVAVGNTSDAPTAVLRNAALSVSTPHGRVVTHQGAQHTHLLDPQRARSAQGAILAAAVDVSAALADAWSTALLVRGDAAEIPAGTTALIATPNADGSTRWWSRGEAPHVFEFSHAEEMEHDVTPP